MSTDTTASPVYRNVTDGYNPISGEWYARRYRTWPGRIGTHWCEDCSTAKLLVEVTWANLNTAERTRYCGVYHLYTDKWTHIDGSNVRVCASPDGRGVYYLEDKEQE